MDNLLKEHIREQNEVILIYENEMKRLMSLLDKAESSLQMLCTWREAIELTDAGRYIGGIFQAFNFANEVLDDIKSIKENTDEQA